MTHTRIPARSPEETHALLEAAFNAGDPDAFVEVYEENATLVVPPEGDVVSGRAAIRRAIEPMFALQPLADMRVVSKLESGDLALTEGRWTLVGTGAEGERMELTGHGTIVSRRQPDGSWRIVLDHPVATG